MKVACSSCKTSYNINLDKIPANVTSVKCAKCRQSIPLKRPPAGKPAAGQAKTVKKTGESASAGVNVKSAKTVQCPHCAEMVPAGGKKCTQCGKALSADDKKSAAVSQTLAKFGSTLLSAAKKQAGSLKESLNAGLKSKPSKGLPGKGGASALSHIEQKVLFNFTRYVAWAAIVVLFVGMAISFMAYRKVGDWKYITYEAVGKAIDSSEPEADRTIQESLPEIDIPKSVERYMRGDNKKVLLGWLSTLNDEDKKDFLKNLDHVITTANKKDPERVFDYINTYKKLKLAKVNENPFNAHLEKAARTGLLISILLIIGSIGLFSLVLVMLAVERNTRILLSRNEQS